MTPESKLYEYVALLPRNTKRDRSIILVADDNMATCLMVYILATLLKDFNKLAWLDNQQFHVGSADGFDRGFNFFAAVLHCSPHLAISLQIRLKGISRFQFKCILSEAYDDWRRRTRSCAYDQPVGRYAKVKPVLAVENMEP
jgi:hypothetical protein